MENMKYKVRFELSCGDYSDREQALFSKVLTMGEPELNRPLHATIEMQPGRFVELAVEESTPPTAGKLATAELETHEEPKLESYHAIAKWLLSNGWEQHD